MNDTNPTNSETTPMPPRDGSPTPDAEDASRSESVRVEEFRVNGNDLVEKVKELIHEGNLRRIIILKGEDGHPLLEIPLTIGVIGGVVGTALFPFLAALGVIGAMVTRLTLVIERKVDP